MQIPRGPRALVSHLHQAPVVRIRTKTTSSQALTLAIAPLEVIRPAMVLSGSLHLRDARILRPIPGSKIRIKLTMKNKITHHMKIQKFVNLPRMKIMKKVKFRKIFFNKMKTNESKIKLKIIS